MVSVEETETLDKSILKLFVNLEEQINSKMSNIMFQDNHIVLPVVTSIHSI